MRKPQLPVLKSNPEDAKRRTANTESRSSGLETRPDPAEAERAELQRQWHFYRREWHELLERAKLSSHFRNADDKCKLLDWFWSRFPEKATDIDIETEFFGNRQEIDLIDAIRSRVALGELRKRLAAFSADERGEKWLLEIPIKKGGTRLNFSPANRPSSATQSFWNAHLRSFEDPILITGSLLFFYDTNLEKIIRYYDFNVKGDPGDDEILSALKVAHPEETAAGAQPPVLEPWRDAYLASGDVRAYELFLKWFHRESGAKILIERKTSREVTRTEVHRRNAILIGRPPTNPHIDTLMNSEKQKARFAFRIHPLKGAMQISNINPGDYPELAQFPISSHGVVGPIWDQDRIFGILTRFPNPGGRGYVTIISTGHYAMVAGRIVGATTDETNAAELLRQMAWPVGEPLPDAFEMVFTIERAPGGLEGESFPKLLLWRQC